MSNVSGLGDSQIDEILHDVDPEAIGIVPDDYVAEGYGEIADFEDAEGTGGCFGDPVYEPEPGGIFDDVGVFGGGFGDPVYVPENSGFFDELITGNESAGDVWDSSAVGAAWDALDTSVTGDDTAAGW